MDMCRVLLIEFIKQEYQRVEQKIGAEVENPLVH